MGRSEGEERILPRLGGRAPGSGMICLLRSKQQLFEHAVAMAEAGRTAQLKEQIARVLHTHKDDARASR